MASLKYRIRGFGIRGYLYTKDEWEVNKVYMTVKRSDGGALYAYNDQDVCAGSLPQELQRVLREFLLSKPSSVIKVKVTSYIPVFKVEKKGQEIPCDIELIGENAIPVRNAIKGIQEEIKKRKKQRKEISHRKMPFNDKNSSNNVKKRKRTLGNNHLTEGSGPKKRKTEASTSVAQTKLGAYAKQKFTFRYQYLLIEIGAEVLRMVFNQRVGDDFMHYLNANPTQYDQLKFLMDRHIITDSQQNHLPPIDNKPSSSKFDITLLACLLKNVCGLRHQKHPVWYSPDPTDFSVEADITRLRKCRNNLEHIATVSISETDSTARSNELIMILKRLSKTYRIANLPKTISDACDMDIDEEMKDHHTDTLKLWDEMETLFDHGVGKMKQKVDIMQEAMSEIKTILKIGDTVNQGQNQLCKEDCHKLSKHIGSNWRFLGFELGITHVQIEHIMDDSRTTRGRIEQMLSLWIDDQGQCATIDKFITAMEACKDLSFDKHDINLYFEELKKKRL